jgi:hypothetical protein
MKEKHQRYEDKIPVCLLYGELQVLKRHEIWGSGGGEVSDAVLGCEAVWTRR